MSSRYTSCKIIPHPDRDSEWWTCNRFPKWQTCDICDDMSLIHYVCSGCQKQCCESCFKDFYIYFEEKTEKIISPFRFCSKQCIIDNSSQEELSKIVEIFKKDQGDQKYKIDVKTYHKSEVSVMVKYQFVRLTQSTKFYYKK